MGLWPSRGLYLTGFEIKVSRQDLLNELKNPAKADSIARYCDFWYLVLGDKNIIKQGELHHNWGFILPERQGLRIVKEAVKNENPAPIDRTFLASLMRNAYENDYITKTVNAAVSKASSEAFERGKKFAESRSVYDIPHIQGQHEKLKKIIAEFSDASGIDLMKNSWRGGDYPKQLGEAVAKVLDGGITKLHDDRMELMKKTAQKILEDIKFIEDFDKPEEPEVPEAINQMTNEAAQSGWQI